MAADEHFIPFRKSAVFRMLEEDGGLEESERKSFRELGTILDALFHYEYHSRLEGFLCQLAEELFQRG